LNLQRDKIEREQNKITATETQQFTQFDAVIPLNKKMDEYIDSTALKP